MGQIKITKNQEKEISKDKDILIKKGKLIIKDRKEVIKKKKQLEIIDKIKTGKYTHKDLAKFLERLLK